MNLYSRNDFLQLNESGFPPNLNERELIISIYAEYLRDTNLYEAATDLTEVSKKEVAEAEAKAKKNDYSGVAKIFKGLISKTKKAGIAAILVLNLMGSFIHKDKAIDEFEKEGIPQAAIEQFEEAAEKKEDMSKTETLDKMSVIGYNLSKEIKESDKDKAAYSKTPCYEYTFKFMKKLNPNIPNEVLKDMKMSYHKDINSLSAKETKKLSEESLTDENVIKDLNYINDKYNIGKIINNPSDVKVGDVVNFWVYDLIEFSPKEKNYSYKDTEAEFEKYAKEHNLEVKDEDWFIEGVKIVWGHYAVVSAVDGEFIYLSSSGEKSGPNGIWNNVPKNETEEFLTKLRKDDIKFSKLSLEDIKFHKTDDISNMRARIPLRISILRVN